MKHIKEISLFKASEFTKTNQGSTSKALLPQRAMSMAPTSRSTAFHGGGGRRRSTIFDEMADIGRGARDILNLPKEWY